MNRLCGILTALLLIVASSGCARTRAATAPPATTLPATRPVEIDPRAMLPLDQIEPVPAFAPATAPAVGEAPLEAIELFARARDARARNQPFSAINLLEQAIRLDPHSFELLFALGSAYQRAGNLPRATDAYHQAAAIKPDDLVLQAELGRAYMQQGDAARAILHLRLARMTDDYRDDPALAAAIDYRLGLALQQAGYDRAALDVYAGLLEQLGRLSGSIRAHPEVVHLMSRPEFLLEQIGRLYEKHGQLDEALSAWELVAQRAPDDFAAQTRVVKTLLAMGRTDAALQRAVQLVTQFRASSESLAFLRDIHRDSGRPEALVDELRRLYVARPRDRVVLFALADALDAAGRPEQAEKLMLEAAQQRDGDVEIVWRLAHLLMARGRVERAAQILIETSAQHPQTTAPLLPLWAQLASPGRRDGLRVEDIRGLPLPADAEPARLYYLWRVARAWNRLSIAHSSLEQAVRARPLFPPAFRDWLDDIWSQDESDEPQKQASSAALVAAAREAADEALALELEGATALARRDFTQAASLLDQALRLEDAPAPELLLSQAAAARGLNDAPRFEQLAWRLVSEHPRYEPAYAALFRHYMDRGNGSAARNVLGTWLANLPDSADARLLEATVQLRLADQPAQAERMLLAVLADHADRLDVLANLRALYTESNQLPKFIDLLEQERAKRPHNYAAVAQLVDLYATQQRLPEATRVLDAARASFAQDPQRLYFVAHLYQRIDQPQQGEQVLEQVLRLDPSFAPAANDLGYTWADGGRNLDRAEALIRRAVEAEPGNSMFLDSLGWVLYKQGRFAEARQHLARAAADQRGADPVILDHLGDALYRLNETAEAVKQWRASLERIVSTGAGRDPEHYNALRLHLDQKLRQAERGEPVSVSPTAAIESGLGQAKN